MSAGIEGHTYHVHGIAAAPHACVAVGEVQFASLFV